MLIAWHFVRQVALHKLVGTLLPNVQASHTLRLHVVRTPTVTKSEAGPSGLAVWTLAP